MRPVAPLPELDQGRGEQRQAAGLAGDVADQRRDQSRLDPQAGPAGGQLDRPPQLVAAHRPDQDLVGAHERRELGVLGAARIEVAANREHDHQPLVGVAGALDQRVEKRLPLGLVATGDEGLLELVDQEHQALTGLEPVKRVGDPRRRVLAPRLGHRPGEGPRELGQRPLAGAHHRPPPVLRAGDDPVGQRRQQAGAHGRGLAAARGADHREQGRADQAGDQLCDQALAAEEVLGVGGVEGRQAAEGADRRLRRIRRLFDGVEAGTFAGPLQVDHAARYRCLSRAQLGLIVRGPARRRGQPLGHLRPSPAAGGAVNAKRHPLALGEQCRHGDDDALGGVERGDFGRRTLAQRVEPQPLGGAVLQQGGERGRALLVVMKDADHERAALGLAGEGRGGLEHARGGVVGVVEHQQRRSVARGGLGDGRQRPLGGCATAGVKHRRTGALDLACELGHEPRLADLRRAPRRGRRPPALRSPAPSACAARPARARVRRAAASRPRAGRAARRSATVRRGSGSWARICSCRRLQLGARLDPDLLDQRLARLAVGLERLGLAPVAIEGEHALCVQALSQGLLGDQRLEPGDRLGVAPGGELGVDRQLDRPQVKLLEPADLGSGERLGGDVGERGAAPELERGSGQAVRPDARQVRGRPPRRGARSAARRPPPRPPGARSRDRG